MKQDNWESAEQESLQLQVKYPGGPGHSKTKTSPGLSPSTKVGATQGGISSEQRKSNAPPQISQVGDQFCLHNILPFNNIQPPFPLLRDLWTTYESHSHLWLIPRDQGCPKETKCEPRGVISYVQQPHLKRGKKSGEINFATFYITSSIKISLQHVININNLIINELFFFIYTIFKIGYFACWEHVSIWISHISSI